MTENEYTMDELIDFMYNVMDDSDEEAIPFVKEVIQALEEIQQYRAIGTVEEFKALKEKAEPKRAEVNEFDYGEGYVCGECESFLHYVDDDDEHIRTNYCCHCGTKIDWQ